MYPESYSDKSSSAVTVTTFPKQFSRLKIKQTFKRRTILVDIVVVDFFIIFNFSGSFSHKIVIPNRLDTVSIIMLELPSRELSL